MLKSKDSKAITYGPALKTKDAHGFVNVRWVENVSDGLRRVGFADEINRMRHRGWFTDDDGDRDEVFRGSVYRLPARDGMPQFVYGYDDPCNDDCALLSFDPVADEKEAARYADDVAESFAEAERDYHRASDAGRRFEELDVEIKGMRKEALAIAAEMRAARKAAVQAPTICATLRAKVLSLYRRIQKARDKRAALLNDYGNCAGFRDASGG